MSDMFIGEKILLYLSFGGLKYSINQTEIVAICGYKIA